MIAFTEVDKRHIPIYRIVHQGKDSVGEGSQEDHRYPFAGRANAQVRLGVVTVATGEVVWMEAVAGGPQPGLYEYLARVRWFPSGDLVAQLEDRSQLRLDIIRFNPATGAGSLLLRETSATWINLHDLLHPLPDSNELCPGGFIWGS